MLHAAIHHGVAEPLLACAHQNRRSPYATAALMGYGLKVYPPAGVKVFRQLAWAPELEKRRSP
jgi:hypothetical protein